VLPRDSITETPLDEELNGLIPIKVRTFVVLGLLVANLAGSKDADVATSLNQKLFLLRPEV